MASFGSVFLPGNRLSGWEPGKAWSVLFLLGKAWSGLIRLGRVIGSRTALIGKLSSRRHIYKGYIGNRYREWIK